jgi:hypothetical protein
MLLAGGGPRHKNGTPMLEGWSEGRRHVGFQDEHVYGEEAVKTPRLTQKRGRRLRSALPLPHPNQSTRDAEAPRAATATVPCSVVFTNGKRPGASPCGRQEHKDPVTR